MKNKPNILIFIPHDLGDHLGSYGYTSVKSPNLDRLASQGVRFTKYFTTAPECTSSRSSMMTGLYTHQNGLMGLVNFGWELYPHVNHLAKIMKLNGYITHLFGFQHETHRKPENLGYMETHSLNNIGVDAVCAELITFLKSHTMSSDTPWFAYTGFKDVHSPWRENTDFDPASIEVPKYLPDTPEVKKSLSMFYGDIKSMDIQIGKVLEVLEDTGLAENTIVIFTTDHGCAFPRAKSTFYDPGIKIPLIISGATLQKGKIINGLYNNIDFVPTVLDICGIEIPEGLMGKSFYPVLSGKSSEDRESIYGAIYYDVSYDPMYYVRTKDFKYIRSFAVTDKERQGVNKDVVSPFKMGNWIRLDDAQYRKISLCLSRKKFIT